jgi:membrane associated rhomboid family serine protease
MKFLRKPFRYSYHYVTWWLLGINVVVFLVQQLWPDLTSYMALNVVNVIRAHAWWQFLSYMFAHEGVTHILFNMLALLVFGMPVERQLGSKEFLLYYLLTGILAGVFSFFAYWFSGAWNVFLLGASGALFAVQLLYAVLFPRSRLMLWGIIPIRAPILVLGFTVLELGSSIIGVNSSVAHLTHLAGFAFGWLYTVVRFGINPIKVWRGELPHRGSVY